MFGLPSTVIRCTESMTLDEFRDGLLIEGKPEEQDTDVRRHGVGFNSDKVGGDASFFSHIDLSLYIQRYMSEKQACLSFFVEWRSPPTKCQDQSTGPTKCCSSSKCQRASTDIDTPSRYDATTCWLMGHERYLRDTAVSDIRLALY